MAIEKSERLLNLTMALLSSRKFLTKSEIFSTVAGYELDSDSRKAIESRDRMFERDKDDLRASGITLDVGSHDPLFDDEIGYRITPESYYLPEVELTSFQYSLINLAMALWKGTQWEGAAQNVGIKLNTPSVNNSSIPEVDPFTQELKAILPTIVTAISERATLTFNYPSREITQREVEPIHIFVSFGDWYILAFDLMRQDLRRFKVKRIFGEISVGKKGSAREHKNISLSNEIDTFGPESSVDVIAHIEESAIDHVLLPINRSYDPIDKTHSLTFNSIDEALRTVFLLGNSLTLLSPQYLIDELKLRVEASSNG